MRLTTTRGVVAFVLFAACMGGAGSGRLRGQGGSQSSSQTKSAEAGERVRVAEGEYRVYAQGDNGIGPFDPAVHNFVQTWALWRLGDKSLEVDGERTYESPQYEAHKDSFSVRLTRQFRVREITEYKKLRWRPDSGPLTCDFLPKTLDCSSGAKDPAQEIRMSLPVPAPYGFLWPISAFSLGNITRFVERQDGNSTPVDMVEIDETSKENPVFASLLEGRLSYAGQERATVAGQTWMADKFVLKVPLHPAFMIWTSRQGLLLDFTLENNAGRLTEQGMKLVRYQQFAEF